MNNVRYITIRKGVCCHKTLLSDLPKVLRYGLFCYITQSFRNKRYIKFTLKVEYLPLTLYRDLLKEINTV